MVEKFFVAVVVVGLVIIVVKGLWSATAVRKGTGCPICDAHGAHDHDHDHDHEHTHEQTPTPEHK